MFEYSIDSVNLIVWGMVYIFVGVQKVSMKRAPLLRDIHR